jgi:RNA polymerase sigma factor (sigma-70 family)
MDDVRVLVEAAAGGDAGAWRELVRRYERLVWHMARLEGLDEIDARDAAQATWLRLVEHLAGLREPERLASWLAITGRREAVRLRTRSRRLRPTDPWELPDEPSGEQVEADVLEQERSKALLAALGRLSTACQALIRLLICETSYEDISVALGIAVGSIGPTRARCLARLARDDELRAVVR